MVLAKKNGMGSMVEEMIGNLEPDDRKILENLINEGHNDGLIQHYLYDKMLEYEKKMKINDVECLVKLPIDDNIQSEG